MQALKIAAIQAALHWEETDANLAMFEEKIWQLDKGQDLILLPEMFSTGFSMQPKKLAEPMGGRSMRWMEQMAAQTKAVITGSLIIKEEGKFFNRLIWMRPDGTFSIYDKRHLFTFVGEEKVYSPGSQTVIEELKGWKIMPLVCYDLRFPVWSRNTQHYDLLLYVANWPEVRSGAWKTLLRARAIENVCFVAGLNRVGEDGNGVSHSGDSAIIDFKGDPIDVLSGKEGTVSAVLDKDELQMFRKKFTALEDGDTFTITGIESI